MAKSIKMFIKKARGNRMFFSSFMSLIFTLIALSIFNFEQHENSLVATVWMKTIMLGVILYISFFVLIQSDFIIEDYKRAIRERDEYIDHLKELIVQQIEKDVDKKNG